MLTPLAALLAHPHPVLRAIIGLMLLGSVFTLLGVALYARHRRHVEMASRLRILEAKLDRLEASATHSGA